MPAETVFILHNNLLFTEKEFNQVSSSSI